MEALRLESTRRTPEIVLDPSGRLSFSGRSITENPAEFFEPIDTWVQEYLKTRQKETIVDIRLEYFNSGSARQILDILQALVNGSRAFGRLQINWYYEEGDDDILERGEYYASILDTNFNFIEYE